MPGFDSFFGLSQSTRADGFPMLPVSAQTSEPTGSVRHIALDGSTDTIRVPQDSKSAGVPTLGWRRVDRFETGGAAVWIIDWNAVATFTGGAIGQLDDASWSNCCIAGSKFYAGFYDEANGIGNGAVSYLLRADLATGAIESVTQITAAVTAISAATRDRTMSGEQTIGPFWWEIDDTQQLIAYYGESTSTQTEPGISRVVYNAALDTVVSEAIYFDSSQATVSPWSPPAYVSEDFSVVVGALSGTNMQIGVPSTRQVITISTTENLLAGADFIFALGGSAAQAALRSANMCIGDVIAIKRQFTTDTGATGSNGAKNVIRPFVRRRDLDAYLKQLVFNFSGVIL